MGNYRLIGKNEQKDKFDLKFKFDLNGKSESIIIALEGTITIKRTHSKQKPLGKRKATRRHTGANKETKHKSLTKAMVTVTAFQDLL